MHNIISERPYQFVAPRHGRFWPWVSKHFLNRHLSNTFGVEEIEFIGAEKLVESLKAKHGVLITPNHCRPADPFVLSLLAKAAGAPPYIMASRHLFEQNRFQTWLLPRLRVFSVYREGLDTAAVKEAIEILKLARGPLVIFPEGLINRANDRIGTLIEGTSMISRNAAKQRAKADGGKVVLHPTFIRYRYLGDLTSAVLPVIAEVEKRLTWTPAQGDSIIQRINRIGEALIGLKEMEYTGRVGTGNLHERAAALSDSILSPLEAEWKIKKRELDPPGRVRALRGAIVPELSGSEIDESERARRWKQLGDLYLAQQLSLYPPDYIASKPTAERILETVERFEEDLTDNVRIHRPFKATVYVGDAMEVSGEKGGESETPMEKIRSRLEEMLQLSGKDLPLWAG